MGTIYTIWLRNLKRYMRSKSRIIGSLAQPLFFLLVLGFGLSSFSVSDNGVSYSTFLVPGIVAMAVLFTSIFSGIQIIWDRQFGFLKETLIAPVSRTAIMFGQTLGGATTAWIQGLLILIIATLTMRLNVTLSGLAIAFVFMVLIGLTFTAMGIAIASKMEDMHGFQLIMNFLIMPVFFLSGAIFPLDKAPTFMKAIAAIDPMTYGVEGMRYGLLGVSNINPLVCLGVLGSIALVMILLGGYLFNKIKV
jgi:ABC-2 type transport system permease protein